jgi:hypothetical protein
MPWGTSMSAGGVVAAGDVTAGAGVMAGGGWWITLAAGQSRTLTFPLGPAELRYWNAAARDWVIDTTTIDVFAGRDSTADPTTSFTIGS